MPEAPLFIEIPQPQSAGSYTSAHVATGRLVIPQQQILIYPADEWERFIEEWVFSQRPLYKKVLRFSGANDMGVDVAGFCDDKELFGVWDNFQCKHYNDPLTSTIAIKEVGKIIWHSFKKHYLPPRKSFFIAPKDCGIGLKRLLGNATGLNIGRICGQVFC